MTTPLTLDLSGRLALVTGASGELGRVIATTLARCGADVVVHYRSNASVAEAVAEAIHAMGRNAAAIPADITDAASVAGLRDAIGDAFTGRTPDIIVANAVSQYSWTTVLEQPASDYEDQFRSCVLQNVLLAQTFLPALKERGKGRYIAINTECAMQCAPSQSAYVAGKRGMDGVLRVLAREVGPFGITVNQVAPGWMISEKYRESGTERQEGYEKNVPLRRRGEDQDVANAVAFLASDLAGFITGVYLPVCGGNVMPTI